MHDTVSYLLTNLLEERGGVMHDNLARMDDAVPSICLTACFLLLEKEASLKKWYICSSANPDPVVSISFCRKFHVKTDNANLKEQHNILLQILW